MFECQIAHSNHHIEFNRFCYTKSAFSIELSSLKMFRFETYITQIQANGGPHINTPF